MQTNFKTKRLTLAALSAEDAIFIQGLVNTPGWLRFIGDRNVHSAEDSRAYVDKIRQNPAIKYWTVSADDQPWPVGIITLIQRDYFEYPDLGFALLPESEGKGYAFEAASVVMKHIRNERICRRLLAATLPDNEASVRLLLRLGFLFVGPVKLEEHNKLLYAIDLV